MKHLKLVLLLFLSPLLVYGECFAQASDQARPRIATAT
jgi:hypothetical protein